MSFQPRTGLDRLMSNIAAGFLFACLQRGATALLHASSKQFLALILLSVGMRIICQFLDVGSNGMVEWNALPYMVYDVALLLLAGWAAARSAGNESFALPAVTALAAIGVVTGSLSALLLLLPTDVWQQLGEAAWPLWWAPFIWQGLAGIVALVRICDMLPEQRMGAILSVVYLLFLPHFLVDGNERFWSEDYSTTATQSAENRQRWDDARNEAMLYTQNELLASRLSSLRAAEENSKKPQLFLVAVAGYGSQDVFMREVLKVDADFATRFNTQHHSVVLINNPATVKSYPLATVTALQRSLQAVGKLMNHDRDVLLLFMTSHGAADFSFDLSLWPYSMNELTPEVLQAALDGAGIKHRIIVVSACYSGGFVPKLANADSLVMSAAREDRNSHGCSHEAEWTFFGKAYFAEAIQETADFEAAFYKARDTIAKREADEKLKPSEPQIAVGENIRPLLKILGDGGSH